MKKRHRSADERPDRVNSRVMKRALAQGRCLRFSTLGADYRSKRVLLYVGILASIWPARKPRLLRHLQTYLDDQSTNSLIEIALKPSGVGSHDPSFPVVFRVGDRADYQTLWECLNDDIYVHPPNPVEFLFDGGANLGLFTLAVCRSVPIKEAIVVEPDPDNLRLMRRNIARLPQAVVIEGALASHEGEVLFARAGSNTGHVAGAPSNVGGAETIAVPGKTLSGTIPSTWNMSRTWLKLDVEGAEYGVVPELLQSPLRPAAISLEIHEYESAGGHSLVRKLTEAGYDVSMLDPGSPSNTCRQILALRRSA
jgi:FkbM family methyltransferase